MGSNRYRLISEDDYTALDDEGHYQLGLRVRKHRAERTMAAIDKMPAELRECVHEHGIGIVSAFVSKGVTSARSIDYLVKVVRGIRPNTGGLGNYGNRRRAKADGNATHRPS